jgi:hypothetical protein
MSPAPACASVPPPTLPGYTRYTSWLHTLQCTPSFASRPPQAPPCSRVQRCPPHATPPSQPACAPPPAAAQPRPAAAWPAARTQTRCCREVPAQRARSTCEQACRLVRSGSFSTVTTTAGLTPGSTPLLTEAGATAGTWAPQARLSHGSLGAGQPGGQLTQPTCSYCCSSAASCACLRLYSASSRKMAAALSFTSAVGAGGAGRTRTTCSRCR